MLCCSITFTYVDEIGPVLTGHTETEIPPEARVFLDHLQEKQPSLRKLIKRNMSFQHKQETLYTAGEEKYFKPSPQCSTTLGSTLSTSGAVFETVKGEDMFDYQLLLHGWDVLRTSIDQSRVVLAEQDRVEHLFT